MLLTRKRRHAFDIYVESLLKPLEKKQRTELFYENLRYFYRKKWGLSLKLPFVNGRVVDLSELYDVVISLGGWQKITTFDRWNEVLQKLSIDENIQMAEHAVRLLYMQFLSKFEQNENGGDIVDEHENELLGARANRSKGFNTITYSHDPPFVVQKASEIFVTPDFHKVIFSLLSGLPNEISFALNILTIISNPGPFLLDFTYCPGLINILIAIIGINVNLDDVDSTSTLYDWWQESSGYDMIKFWMNAGIEERELQFSIYNPKNMDIKCDMINVFHDGKFDLNDPINWRVFNVIAILHNLSFEEMNEQPMAENRALVRLLTLLCNCRWQILQRIAFEIFSNISKNILLLFLEENLSTGVFFNVIKEGLFCNDKFKVIRSMEIIAGLCKNTENESIIYEFLVDESQIIPHIIALLSLKDILICVVALETLLQISELNRTCELIAVKNHAVELLLGMLTTDAASFGQSGLFGIKVVEVRGHHMRPYIAPSKKNWPPQNNILSNNNPHHSTSAVLSEVHRASTILTENSREIISPEHSLLCKSPNSMSTLQISHQSYMNEYMCEWMMQTMEDNERIEPCSRFFSSGYQLFYHIFHDHLKNLVQSHTIKKSPDNVFMIRCRWPLCDNTQRTLWSMTTHLQDVHCADTNLEANMRRRCEIGLDEYINQIRTQFEKDGEQIQESGYSPFAAYEAIRRHAFTNTKKEITDDSEGPVTRNLRLTSALILRNICKNSVTGRKKIRRSESLLSWLSFSNLESSKILAQCLAEILKYTTDDLDCQKIIVLNSLSV